MNADAPLQASSLHSHHTAWNADPTPETLRNGASNDAFWKDMENVAREGDAQHTPGCVCRFCKERAGGQTGENAPQATDTGGNPTTNSAHPPPRTGPPGPNVRSSRTSPAARKEANASAANATSKNSFTAIYADRVNLKSDYRKEMISSKDKWKAQDLLDRREARADAAKREESKALLERKHQIRLENVASLNVMKKVRVEQEFAREDRKDARRNSLLQTLLGSARPPSEIMELLPILNGE